MKEVVIDGKKLVKNPYSPIYYIPKQEELRIGLECEYLTNENIWIKHTLLTIMDIRECNEVILYQKIRVKYLDTEDIIEL